MIQTGFVFGAFFAFARARVGLLSPSTTPPFLPSLPSMNKKDPSAITKAPLTAKTERSVLVQQRLTAWSS